MASDPRLPPLPASCGDNFTLFDSLVVGNVDNPTDRCSVQLNVTAGDKAGKGIETYQVFGDHTGMSISTFAIKKLDEDIEYINLGDNKLTRIPTFTAKIKTLLLTGNPISSLQHVYLPPSVTVLALRGSKGALRELVNVTTLPSTLEKLNLNKNPITRIQGVDFPSTLTTLDLGGCPIEMFEIADRHRDVFMKMRSFSAKVTLTNCPIENSSIVSIQDVDFCVLPDAEWTARYRPFGNASASTTPAPTASKPGGSSSSSAAIIGVIVAVVVLLLVGVAGWRYRRNKTKHQSKHTNGTATLGGTVEASQSESTAVSSSLQQNDLWNDRVIAKTRIAVESIHEEKKLGQGAFGEVYQGTCCGRRVAIKRLRETFRENDKYLDSFIMEIKLMASMNHPNIVQYIGIAGINLTNMMVVFELMDGGDLRGLIVKYKEMGKSTGFDRARLMIAFDIANALTYLHSLEPKVLHRDLKSQNVLLNKQMEAKLTDFGIARAQSENMTVGIGTMRWMAPEVMMSDRYDEKADIFSFGVVLSELDTLELPYANSTDEHGRKLKETALFERVSRGAISVEFTETRMPELVELAKQCVALDPESRPEAAEAAYRLQQVIKTCKQ